MQIFTCGSPFIHLNFLSSNIALFVFIWYNIYRNEIIAKSEAGYSMAKHAGKDKGEKTNVMRLLDQAKIEYKHYSYASAEAISGTEVAAVLNQNPAQVFKTLVTVGKSGAHYVFVIPVAGELDLKKAAKAVGDKAVDMLKSKDLLPLTGYIHGGCSPIGMKKLFTTVVDKSAEAFDTILFSGGKIGYQVEVAPSDLKKLVPFTFAEVTV